MLSDHNAGLCMLQELRQNMIRLKGTDVRGNGAALQSRIFGYKLGPVVAHNDSARIASFEAEVHKMPGHFVCHAGELTGCQMYIKLCIYNDFLIRIMARVVVEYFADRHIHVLFGISDYQSSLGPAESDALVQDTSGS